MSLAAQAEGLKLRRLLGADPAELGFVNRLSPRDIRLLRQGLWAQRQRQDTAHVRPLLGIARWLPAVLAAWVCERRLGLPLVAALAGELALQQTLGIARLLSPARLADVCTELDPRVAHDLVHVLPEAKVVAVACELLSRGDHLTLGRFADHLGDAALVAVLGVIVDDADLLHTVYFIESRSRLDHILHLLPVERRQRLMQLLLHADSAQLQQLMFLLSSVSPGLQAELGALAAADTAMLTRLLELTREQDCWADTLPLLLAMNEPDQRRLLTLPLWQEQPELLQGLWQAAEHEHYWLTLLPLCALMSEPMQQASAQIIAMLPQGIEHASRAALAGEYWGIWLSLLAAMPEPRQQDFARVLRGYGEVDVGLEMRVARLAGPLADV